MLIRFFDIVFSLFGLLILSPFLLIISLLVLLSSKGGVFFLQERVGKKGKVYRIYKFRTMYPHSDKQGQLTIGYKDKRITPIGLFLRRYKLDELPQLFNVLQGEMSMVGPRPEVPKYVALYSEKQKEVLRVKPGITDLASLEYFNENELLKNAPDPEEFYIQNIMPEKLKINSLFIQNPSLKAYFSIIIRTIFRLFK